MKKKTEITNE